MGLKVKRRLFDGEGLRQILDHLAREISKDDIEFEHLAMVGVLTTGAPIAEYLARRLSELKNVDIPVAFLDISLYRDDNLDTDFDPYDRRSEIPFPVKNRPLVLVDDVLYTGRTVRAALTSIVSLGRPKLVRLAVVVDRGHRELPIKADYVGLHVDTTRDEGVRVRFKNPDKEDGIFLVEKSLEG